MEIFKKNQTGQIKSGIFSVTKLTSIAIDFRLNKTFSHILTVIMLKINCFFSDSTQEAIECLFIKNA